MTIDLTTKTDEAFSKYFERNVDSVEKTAKAIFFDLIPNRPLVVTKTETRERFDGSEYEYERQVTDEVDVTDLEVGDLVANLGDLGYYALRHRDLHEQLNYSGGLYAVVKKSPKTVTVASVHTARGWWGYGDSVSVDEDTYTERWGQSSSRTLFKVGTLAEFTEGWINHPKRARLTKVIAAVAACDEEHTRRHQAAQQVKKDASKVMRKHNKALTKAIDVESPFSVYGSEDGTVEVSRASGRYAIDWADRADDKVIGYVIKGRLADGEITQEQADKGLAALQALSEAATKEA